ncbi:hypothetical protein BOO69_04085 [Sulfitobacter alexandrii]|uniref:Fucosyltransferase C-terminal domain-containing protein n=1 Tax=Sulfitobacter alexandrii TaxID=1917485 RepID=A0A1J0WEE8_9RHOB|nr:glycosyltransferase family 10 [Sulfitobacter alexandrii]APE42693.1 hypothetical protein BOO69_04085 [Sulfitobacter alexandrii]
MTDLAIAVLPYGRKLGAALAQTPLDELVWPLGRPERLARGTAADLRPTDHLIVYPKTAMHFQRHWGTRARVSVMVVEPAVIHRRHLRLLRLTWRRFHRVLCHDDALLAAIPNGVMLPFGTSWIPDPQAVRTEKERHMSLIASAKRDTEGHLLRHAMVDMVRHEGLSVEILGRGYAPFAEKSDGLAPYRFSVVIENIRERNYFTEKIVDAVLCETVPIYWGCPNIGDFMDTGGMVICEDASQMKAAIRAADDALYQRLAPALRGAKSQAAHWADLEGRAARAIKDSL